MQLNMEQGTGRVGRTRGSCRRRPRRRRDTRGSLEPIQVHSERRRGRSERPWGPFAPSCPQRRELAFIYQALEISRRTVPSARAFTGGPKRKDGHQRRRCGRGGTVTIAGHRTKARSNSANARNIDDQVSFFLSCASRIRHGLRSTRTHASHNSLAISCPCNCATPV